MPVIARARRRKATSAYHRQGPTPEMRNHHPGIVEDLAQHDGEGTSVGVTKAYVDRVIDQDTLDWLASRGSLDEAQAKAGRQLHADWIQAGNEQLRAADHTRLRVDGSGGAYEANARLAAQDRVRHALRALGSRQAEVAVEVCVWGTRLGALEKALTMSKNAGIDVVRVVLDRLDEHYGERGVYR